MLESYGTHDTAADLAAILGDRIEVHRAAAINLLTTGVRREVAADVRPFLHDEDATVRQAALSFAASVVDRDAAADVEALLGDEEAAVRAKAADVLGPIGDVEAVPALIGRMADAEIAARKAAATALGLLKDPRAVEALRAAMARTTGEEQYDYALALAEQGEADGWVRALSETGNRATEAVDRLNSNPPPATPATAAQLLGHANPAARRHGLRLAGRGGYGAAAMAERLADVDAEVRVGALTALAAFGARDALAAAKARAADPSASVRAAAILAVDDLGGWTAGELEPLLKDPDADVRTAAKQVYASRGMKPDR
jgi:HEAT repeat protein